jgi:rhomboid protease GluP
MFQRQKTGSIVCPNCGRLVGVQDEKCLGCGKPNPGLWGFAPLLNRVGLDVGFTKIVFTVCGALYAITLLSDPSAIGGGGFLSLLSPGQRPLFLFGASGALPVFGYGRWWTVLSAAWLHGGLLHIAMNMMWLRDLMPAVAQMYGGARLVIIYTVSAATGFGLTSVIGILGLPGPLAGAGFTIGASAPLFGLFGALVVYGDRAGARALGQQVWRWVVIFVVIGLLVPFIDNWAHLGGFAGGYLAARILDPLRDESPREVLVGLVCLALNAAAIVASVLHGLQFFRA